MGGSTVSRGSPALSEEKDVSLLLPGSASVALMERLWRSSPVYRYACATLYLSTGSAAMERDMSKALLSVQKWLVWDATALTSPSPRGAGACFLRGGGGYTEQKSQRSSY